MFDLIPVEQVPAVVVSAPKHKLTVRYYLRQYSKGGVYLGHVAGWYFLHHLHSNGPNEWTHEDRLTTHGGRCKPHFYRTITGAQSAARNHAAEVAVWQE